MIYKKEVQVVVGTKGWILEAIGKQWNEKFNKYTTSELIIGPPKPGAQLYFHLFYADCTLVEGAINIVYVTHFSSYLNSLMILKQFSKGCIFITMSEETKIVIQKLCGNQVQVYSHLPESIHFSNVSYVKEMKFGYFSKRHDDGRKNEALLIKIAQIINNSENSKLLISGSGWSNLIEMKGNNVIFDEQDFDKDKYYNQLKSCDYVLNVSNDEGAISILDAATLKIPVIATGIGYHSEILHAKGSFLFKKFEDIIKTVKYLVQTNDVGYQKYNSIDDIIQLSLTIEKPNNSKISFFNLINIFKINYVYGFWNNIIISLKYFLKKI